MNIERDAFGTLFITTVTGDGRNHRRRIDPGVYVSGVWAPTDISGEPPEIQSAAAAAWTNDTIAAFQAKYPWIAAPPATPSNTPLSMKQLRFGLIQFGGKTAGFIQSIIDAMPSPQKDFAQIWYDESTVVYWDHVETQALMAASGFTTDQCAQMWMAAAAAFEP